MKPEQEAARDFSDYLGQIRHDLRGQISIVIGYAEELREVTGDSGHWDMHNDLGRIRRSGFRLIEVIERALGRDVTRPNDIDHAGTEYQLRAELNGLEGYIEITRDMVEERELEEAVTPIDNMSLIARQFMDHSLNKLESIKAWQPGEIEVIDEQVPVAPDETDEPIASQGTILVVDDVPMNRDIFARALRRGGYVVIEAENGEACIEQLESNAEIELVLLDYRMPGLSGLETLTRIKNNPALRKTPVIMLTANNDPEQAVECILQGAEDYIVKPPNSVLLKARIRATLEMHRLRQKRAKVLKIFVSSPGDVIAERRATKRVVDRLNQELLGNVLLIPFFWEEEPLVAGKSFQEQIPSPREMDIYIGIFWARFGSKLSEDVRRPDGTRYESGTEFEFDEAMLGFSEKNKPQPLVYKKEKSLVVTMDNQQEVLELLDQKQKVDAFMTRNFMTDDGESYTGAYRTFEDEQDYEELLLEQLRKLVLSLLGEPADDRDETS